jgi:tRNA-splicing ligase RtcB
MSISGKDLKKWGLPHGPVFKTALDILNAQGLTKRASRDVMESIIECPESFLLQSADVFKPIAQALIDMREPELVELNEIACPIEYFGKDLMEAGAIDQMHTACLLPISVKGVLLPDSHLGYAIPIGGVLATKNEVIPYGVGSDIGCHIHLSIFDVDKREARGKEEMFSRFLMENTFFGVGCQNDGRVSDPVLDDARFSSIPFFKTKNLRETAIKQLGTSGSSNHFVEWGFVNPVGQEGEQKLALMSHSGSRGFGAKIAKFYTDLAISMRNLPKQMRYLSWLDMDSESGQEYWEAMTLASEFSLASHQTIHSRIQRAAKLDILDSVCSTHNVAVRQEVMGESLIIHRKGAIDASMGVRGVIPSSMSTTSHIVDGKGSPSSMSTASHGTGRAMSRTQARNSFTMSQLRGILKEAGVILLGGSVEECSLAYKPWEPVMEAQKDLVDRVAEFRPWIVRMSE